MLMSLSATFNNEHVEIINVTPVGLDVYVLYKTDDGIVKMSKKCLDTSKTSTIIATSATSE